MLTSKHLWDCQLLQMTFFLSRTQKEGKWTDTLLCSKTELCRKCKIMQNINCAEHISEEFRASMISNEKNRNTSEYCNLLKNLVNTRTLWILQWKGRNWSLPKLVRLWSRGVEKIFSKEVGVQSFCRNQSYLEDTNYKNNSMQDVHFVIIKIISIWQALF